MCLKLSTANPRLWIVGITLEADLMTKSPKISVTAESTTGRNLRFNTPIADNVSRQKLAQEIRAGVHEGYHVRVINGLATPVSNPNGSSKDNLG